MASAARSSQMGRFRLGRILGFEISVDYSWFIILALILWTFTTAVFPVTYPGLAGTTYLAMGIAGALLFFLSLLGHELAHSVVARARGIEVEGITLFIFGGMARMRSEARTPRDEFVIAGVGPLSSLAIAILFAAAWWAGTRLGWSEAVLGVAGYLAMLNVVLAVFNLLPGFPMDGGRVFRAIVWGVTGSLTRATRIASAGGRWVGYLLMFLGFLQLLAGAILGGVWLIFIGWFVRTAAIAGYHQHLMRDALSTIPVRHAMTPGPETVAPQVTLQGMVDDYFLRRRHQAYPVVEGDRPVGLVTLGQVKDVPRERWPHRTVGEAMTPAADLLVEADARMDEVLERVLRSDPRRVLVVEDGRLVGILTGRDVMGLLERMQELEGM